jgi:hypothetical protein
VERPCRESPQKCIEFLLMEICSKQKRMDSFLEGIKSSLANICSVVDEDLCDFLKDLDNNFSLNFSWRWVRELSKFEPEEEHIV